MNDSIELDWRSDDTTLSDLTLVIYDGSGGTPYHVHTLPLAFGGRRSNFVAEQIKQQQKKQSRGSNKEYKVSCFRCALVFSVVCLTWLNINHS